MFKKIYLNNFYIIYTFRKKQIGYLLPVNKGSTKITVT